MPSVQCVDSQNPATQPPYIYVKSSPRSIQSTKSTPSKQCMTLSRTNSIPSTPTTHTVNQTSDALNRTQSRFDGFLTRVHHAATCATSYIQHNNIPSALRELRLLFISIPSAKRAITETIKTAHPALNRDNQASQGNSTITQQSSAMHYQINTAHTSSNQHSLGATEISDMELLDIPDSVFSQN